LLCVALKGNATVTVGRTRVVDEKFSPHLNDVVKVGGEGVSVSLPERRQGYSPRPSSTSRPRPAPNAFRTATRAAVPAAAPTACQELMSIRPNELAPTTPIAA